MLKRFESTTIRPPFWHACDRNIFRSFQIEWLNPLGIDDSFAMVVNGPEARAKNLETLTDAAKAPEPWTLGVGYEFEQRADGLAALKKAYGLQWKGSPKTMDLGLLYKAMEQGQVTMIAANATDGMLSKMDLKVLRDDRNAFPPYQVCILARQDSSEEDTPGLRRRCWNCRDASPARKCKTSITRWTPKSIAPWRRWLRSF